MAKSGECKIILGDGAGDFRHSFFHVTFHRNVALHGEVCIMPTSIRSEEVESTFREVLERRTVNVRIDGRSVSIPKPFPSPEDWRDQWIYFLMVDRFNRHPAAPPNHLPFDGQHGVFQGGNLEGIRQQLPYLQELGVGAIWLSPVIKNCQYEDGTYHGYGFQDFLRIDPRFASDPAAARSDPAVVDRELMRFIDEAHARGIYVIFDVVLNHAGNVFEYDGFGAAAPFRSNPYPIQWHDQDGHPAFDNISQVINLADDAGIWPKELQRNDVFRRQGKGGEAAGDFESLKELVTAHVDATPFGGVFDIRRTLIRAYQYLIARFDVDGFRIDTLKFIEPDFARTFGNAMREFALSIGKKNFFTFGEVFDDEKKIAQFIGRDAGATEDPVGVDAALDFPLFFKLPGVVKGFAAPTELVGLYETRKQVQKGVVSSHGEASAYFVTFLDNHDMKERFYFDDGHGTFDRQLTVGLGCLFTLLGIPCLYYGSEQGLHGRGNADLAVREALWGKPEAFDRNHPFYRTVRQLAAVRQSQPALRYGRLYFRPVSGNGRDFGISPFKSGVIAFSRILNEVEVVVVANTNLQSAFSGDVIVDASLNSDNSPYQVLFSNKQNPTVPGLVTTKPAGSVRIQEADGGTTTGPIRTVGLQLDRGEIQILRIAS